jgi:hypothetical protein
MAKTGWQNSGDSEGAKCYSTFISALAVRISPFEAEQAENLKVYIKTTGVTIMNSVTVLLLWMRRLPTVV